MKTFLKILGTLVVLAIVVVIGLTFAVRHYITDERIKSVVIPQAEKALDRSVTIGEIKVGLLSGITINDFLIKEANGSDDFVKAEAFIVRYDLMPLLQKKLVVNEIAIEGATIRVTRDKNGVFNYTTLALLADTAAPTAEKKSSSQAAALPVALTVDQVRLDGVKLIVRDAKGELPALDATANAKLALDIGQSLADISFQGTFNFAADGVYGEAKPTVKGSGTFDKKNVSITIDTVIDQENIKIEAKAADYATTPDVVVNISSPKLNIDKLMAVASTLPKGEKKPAAVSSGKKAAPAEALPKGFTVRGKVSVAEAVYNKINVTNFTLDYVLEQGILTISNLGMQSYGGQVTSSAEVDLNQPDLAYKGTVSVNSIQAASLTSALSESAAELIAGSLAGSFTFQGAGTKWEEIRDVLTADGTFSLANGQIKDTEISNTIASLLGLPELASLAFQEIAGAFKLVEGGKIMLDTDLNSTDVQASTKGTVGLDGSLDLPLTLTLSPTLGEKLRSKTSFAGYLTNDQGGTTLNLKVAGTTSKPRPTLDSSALAAQARETVKQKLLEKIGEKVGGSASGSSPLPGSDLIKGLFGR